MCSEAPHSGPLPGGEGEAERPPRRALTTTRVRSPTIAEEPMNRNRSLAISLLGLAALAGPSTARAAMASFDLGAPTVTATSASFEVSLTFTGDPTDTINAIQLSVLGSSDELTAAGTDFSRFAFAPNGTN